MRAAATTLLLAVIAGCAPPDPPLRVGLLEWPPYEILRLARDSGALPPDAVEFVEFQSPAEATRAYAAGGIDIVALTLDYEIRLAQASADHRAFLVIDESAGGDAIISREPLARLADVAGRTIGLESSELGVHMLSRLLERAGLSAADVEMAFFDYPDQVGAWEDGNVDLMITYEPNRSRLLELGGHELFTSADIPGEVIDVFITRQSQIEARKEDFRRFVRGWFAGMQRFQADPVAAAELLAPRLDMSPDAYMRAMDRVRLVPLDENRRKLNGRDREFLETIRRFAETVERSGGTAAPADLASLFTDAALPVAEDEAP